MTVCTHEVIEWLKCKALEQGLANSKHLGSISKYLDLKKVFKKGFGIHFNSHFESITVFSSMSKNKAVDSYGWFIFKRNRGVCMCVCVLPRWKNLKAYMLARKTLTGFLSVCLQESKE